MKVVFKAIIIAVIFGALAGAGTTAFMLNIIDSETSNPYEDFYTTETVVHVSPHHLRKAMDKGDDSFILVDVRSEEEYDMSHIKGAVNIPVYKNKDKSDYGSVERITNAFAELDQSKDIIVYCYSTPCMSGRKVGKMLADKGIYVKHLGIGWNEWRYDWENWNHEHEWELTSVEDYIEATAEAEADEDTEETTIYNLEDVAEHATAEDCWMAINGKVYNLTEFIASGNHGAAIEQGCGIDGTELYETRPMGSGTPHSDNARDMLTDYHIGDLVENTEAIDPAYLSDEAKAKLEAEGISCEGVFAC